MDQSVADTGVRLPIVWSIPPDLTSSYATNIVVQHTEREFIVSFFEIQLPILLGSAEERRAALETIRHIEAKCVARVVIAPERMQEFIDVLRDNLKTYLERQRRRSE